MRLALLIPVYNERGLLPRAVARLDATPAPVGTRRTLVVVDDGSTDGTADLVRGLRARPDTVAIVHPRNQGKGAGVRTAMRAALDAGADIGLIHDGDLEYDPADHGALVAPIVRGEADAVIGSRFARSGRPARSGLHWAANRLLTLASNELTGLTLTDMECCLKAFSRGVMERLTIEEDRFGVEPEIVAKLARMTLGDGRAARIAEVPVSYAGRGYAEGKKIGWRDGVAALRCIARYSLRDQDAASARTPAR